MITGTAGKFHKAHMDKKEDGDHRHPESAETRDKEPEDPRVKKIHHI